MNGQFKRRMPGADLVAIVEVGGEDPGAVDVNAVVAAHVHDSAFRRIDFHHEMNAREIFVFAAQPKMGVPGPADEKGVGTVERKNLSLVRAGDDLERYPHSGLDSSFRACAV